MTGYQNIRFAPDMQEAILQGRKRKTSRNSAYEIDGLFLVQGRTFKITRIDLVPLHMVRDLWFHEEGFQSPLDFEKGWKRLHRGHFNPDKKVFLHTFEEVHLVNSIT